MKAARSVGADDTKVYVTETGLLIQRILASRYTCVFSEYDRVGSVSIAAISLEVSSRFIFL